MKQKVDYGFDAPKVIGSLFFFGLLAFACIPMIAMIESPYWFWPVFLYFLLAALALFMTGCWMLYGIRVAKPRLIRQQVEGLNLQGNEHILDLGCGRGLFLIEAAKQLMTGKAVGIDLWQTKDQSGNSPKAAIRNGKIEGVEERIEVKTGDLRCLPFPDQSFDVALSSLALHNIPDKLGRQQALKEMLRVLKPGGNFTILDIYHSKEYTDFLVKQGDCIVKCSSPTYYYCPPITIINGIKASTNES